MPFLSLSKTVWERFWSRFTQLKLVQKIKTLSSITISEVQINKKVWFCFMISTYVWFLTIFFKFTKSCTSAGINNQKKMQSNSFLSCLSKVKSLMNIVHSFRWNISVASSKKYLKIWKAITIIIMTHLIAQTDLLRNHYISWNIRNRLVCRNSGLEGKISCQINAIS